MPELPDVEVYVRRLNALYAGKPLEKIDLKSAFVLRTFDPDVFECEGRVVSAFQRHAKRIAQSKLRVAVTLNRNARDALHKVAR